MKGVGDAAIDSIVATREESGSFASLQDFCERVDTKQVNKRAVESLIMSGAFDSLEGHRAQYIASLENIMKAAQNAQAERDRGQMSLFGDGEETPTATVALVETPELDPLERLMREKEQLGFYVSGHPLEEYGDIIENYTSTSTQSLGENRIDSEVDVAGMITEVNNHTTKKESPWRLSNWRIWRAR